MLLRVTLTVPAALILAACGAGDTPPSREPGAEAGAALPVDTLPPPAEWSPDWATPLEEVDRVTSVEGFSTPLAVEYDPALDVFFVANANGDPDARDGNGFITRLGAEGQVELLRFMTGSPDAPLHAPRGMALEADTLWVVDLDGLHAFRRGTGEHLLFIDMTDFRPEGLRAVGVMPTGEVFVTEPEAAKIYLTEGVETDMPVRAGGEWVEGLTYEVSQERASLFRGLSSLAWSRELGRFVLARSDGSGALLSWVPGTRDSAQVGVSSGGTDFESLVSYEGRFLASSPTDGWIYLFEGGTGSPFIPADAGLGEIALDTRRFRVAVPHPEMGRVDIWQIRSARRP